MSKHTPGPWSAEWQPGQTPKHTYTHCVVAGEEPIADTLTKANAELIAAAPDLLSVVADLVATDGRNEIQYASGRAAHVHYMNLLAAARAAIAKAEGQQ